MVYIKTYIFNHFYEQYLVLFTMVPRNSLDRLSCFVLFLVSTRCPSNYGPVVPFNIRGPYGSRPGQIRSRTVVAHMTPVTPIVHRGVQKPELLRELQVLSSHNGSDAGP